MVESSDDVPSAASLRWRILRRVLLPKSGNLCDDEVLKVSRLPAGSYNLLSCCQVVSTLLSSLDITGSGDILMEYTLPSTNNELKKLLVWQRRKDRFNTQNLISCQEHHVDYTGVVCLWPAEEVLSHFSVSNADIFRGKRVIELGAGYGLGGLAIAAWTEALAVTITDGNPVVLDYINRNIAENALTCGVTQLDSALLDWSQPQEALAGRKYDIIVAADCTFHKDLHSHLVHTIKHLLDASKGSHAILFSPSRGGSLEAFVETANALLLHVQIRKIYDAKVWDLHQKFLGPHKQSWPNYDENHCYPLLVMINSET